MKPNFKKNFKSSILVILSIVLAIGLVGCTPKDIEDGEVEQQKEVVSNNGDIRFLEVDGEIYISIKDAFESVGGEYLEEKDKIKIAKDKDELIINLQENSIILNGEDIQLSDEDIKVEKDLVYVSIEVLNEVLDAKTIFNEEENKVEIRTEIPLEYAETFSVKYLKGGVKKIELEDGKTLILMPEGKEVPEEYNGESVVNIPIEKAMLGTTVFACDLRAIEELDSIIAVTSDIDVWEIQEVIDNMESGKTKFVGKNKSPDYELIYSLKPDVAFITGGRAGNQETMEKFDELGISYVPGTSYLELHPLGRMEWMKLTAAFYDKEDIAEKHFNNAVKNINELQGQFSSEEKPKVIWGRISKGKASVPLAESYAAKMIEIAGGDYVFKDANLESKDISIEEFYDKGKDADIFIWETMGPAPESLEAMIEETPSLADFKTVKEKNVWRLDDDYWQSIDKTDVIVKSLAAILYPDKFDQNEIKHYLRYTE